MADKTIFIRNVPPFFSDFDVKSLFDSVCPIKAAFIARDKSTKKHKGFAFVKLKKATDLDNAIKAINLKEIDEKHVLSAEKATKNDDSRDKKAKIAQKSAKNSEIRPKSSPKNDSITNNLLITGIPSVLDQKQIKESLESIPQVKIAVFPSPESTLTNFCARLIAKDTATAKKMRSKATAKLKKACANSEKVHRFAIKSLWLKSNARLARLIIRNLPFDITEREINDKMSKFGEIIDIKLSQREDNKKINRGFAFVEFKTVTQSEKAIRNLNGKIIKNRKIIIDWAVSKQIFAKVAEKIKKAQEDDLSEEDFVKEESDENETIKEETETVEETIKTESAEKKTKFDHKDAERGKTLFVSGLPFDITEEQLRKKFEPFGKIRYARLVCDRVTKSPKGTAFINFRSKKSVERVLQNGKKRDNDESFAVFDMDGRDCWVTLALTKKGLEETKIRQREQKDPKNINLAHEGVPNFKLPEGKTKGSLSIAIERRQKCLEEKLVKLRNPNFSVSKTRLSVQNLPPKMDQKSLKAFILDIAVKKRERSESKWEYERKRPVVRQSKVVKDNERVNSKGEARSKRFGFVEFLEHKDALNVVRHLNTLNNLKQGGMQVEFAVEDARKVFLHRKKRNKPAEVVEGKRAKKE